jgi:hypothetical protein
MLRVLWNAAILIVLLTSAPACSSGPTTPSGEAAGTWVGTVSDSVAGSGAVTLVLSQQAAGVSGTFSLTFTDASRNRAGAAAGTLAAAVMSLTLTPSSVVVCSPSVTLSGAIGATMTIAGGRMSGTYSSFTCGGAVGGTMDLTRQ